MNTVAQLLGSRALATGLATHRDSSESPRQSGKSAIGDRDLVAALSGTNVDKGAGAACVLLFDRYGSHVRRELVNVLGCDSEVDDLVQEVFVRALAGIDRLRNGDQLKAWLARIAVYTARSFIQRKMRHRSLFNRSADLLAGTSNEPADPTSPDPALREAAHATYRVLDRMNADLRIAFALRFIDGMELKEIATTCGKSLATVKRRLNKARAQFLRLAANEPSLTAYIAECEENDAERA